MLRVYALDPFTLHQSLLYYYYYYYDKQNCYYMYIHFAYNMTITSAWPTCPNLFQFLSKTLLQIPTLLARVVSAVLLLPAFLLLHHQRYLKLPHVPPWPLLVPPVAIVPQTCCENAWTALPPSRPTVERF